MLGVRTRQQVLRGAPGCASAKPRAVLAAARLSKASTAQVADPIQIAATGGAPIDEAAQPEVAVAPPPVKARASRKRASTKAVTAAVVDAIEAPTDVDLVSVAGKRGTREERRSAKKTVGNTATDGDEVMRVMMERTVKQHIQTGQPYVDRASLSEGREAWYCITVWEGKEKKFLDLLDQRMIDERPMQDLTTGELMPRMSFEPLLPVKRVYKIDPVTKLRTGRGKVTKYKDGGFVFINGVLNQDNLHIVEKTLMFSAWRDKLTWKYPFEEEYVDLPKPASQEMMDSVFAWMEETEEITEDELAAVDDRLDTKPENMDVDEQGNTVYKREYTGSFTNPSDMYDGTSVADPPVVAKKTRARKSSVFPPAALPEAAAATTPAHSLRGQAATAAPVRAPIPTLVPPASSQQAAPFAAAAPAPRQSAPPAKWPAAAPSAMPRAPAAQWPAAVPSQRSAASQMASPLEGGLLDDEDDELDAELDAALLQGPGGGARAATTPWGHSSAAPVDAWGGEAWAPAAGAGGEDGWGAAQNGLDFEDYGAELDVVGQASEQDVGGYEEDIGGYLQRPAPRGRAAVGRGGKPSAGIGRGAPAWPQQQRIGGPDAAGGYVDGFDGLGDFDDMGAPPPGQYGARAQGRAPAGGSQQRGGQQQPNGGSSYGATYGEDDAFLMDGGFGDDGFGDDSGFMLGEDDMFADPFGGMAADDPFGRGGGQWSEPPQRQQQSGGRGRGQQWAEPPRRQQQSGGQKQWSEPPQRQQQPSDGGWGELPQGRQAGGRESAGTGRGPPGQQQSSGYDNSQGSGRGGSGSYGQGGQGGGQSGGRGRGGYQSGRGRGRAQSEW